VGALAWISGNSVISPVHGLSLRKAPSCASRRLRRLAQAPSCTPDQPVRGSYSRLMGIAATLCPAISYARSTVCAARSYVHCRCHSGQCTAHPARCCVATVLISPDLARECRDSRSHLHSVNVHTFRRRGGGGVRGKGDAGHSPRRACACTGGSCRRWIRHQPWSAPRPACGKPPVQVTDELRPA
jgi:hypothetical protein